MLLMIMISAPRYVLSMCSIFAESMDLVAQTWFKFEPSLIEVVA